MAAIGEPLKREDYTKQLGGIVKEQRVMKGLTLRGLATKSGVSASHLARIERAERFPSAHILHNIAKPLGFEENELFTWAGYLHNRSHANDESTVDYYQNRRLDPSVASVLSREPVQVQRAILGILSAIKYLSSVIGGHE